MGYEVQPGLFAARAGRRGKFEASADMEGKGQRATFEGIAKGVIDRRNPDKLPGRRKGICNIRRKEGRLAAVAEQQQLTRKKGGAVKAAESRQQKEASSEERRRKGQRGSAVAPTHSS